MHTNKGFSLIELMIVIGIIGILSMMAMPFYSDYIVRLRYTALFTHALHMNRLFDIELASGVSKEDVRATVIDLFCVSGGAIDPGQGSNPVPSCELKPGFALPSNLTNDKLAPDYAAPSMTFEIKDKTVSLWMIYFLTGGNDIISFSILKNKGYYKTGVETEHINFVVKGKEIAKLYGEPKQDFAEILMYKGPDVKLQDNQGKPKATGPSNWYCGFDTVKVNNFQRATTMPTMCRAYKITFGNLDPIFREI